MTTQTPARIIHETTEEGVQLALIQTNYGLDDVGPIQYSVRLRDLDAEETVWIKRYPDIGAALDGYCNAARQDFRGVTMAVVGVPSAMADR